MTGKIDLQRDLKGPVELEKVICEGYNYMDRRLSNRTISIVISKGLCLLSTDTLLIALNN